MSRILVKSRRRGAIRAVVDRDVGTKRGELSPNARQLAGASGSRGIIAATDRRSAHRNFLLFGH